MKILFISPVAIPITPESRYIGIEREVWLYARELVKEHQVSVIGHSLSVYPEGVKLLSVEPESPYFDLELKAYQTYQGILREFDVIHDWSHQHFASRYNKNLPSLNIFFHAPSLAKYPKSPYNIIALSQWAAREFKRVYKQEARYQYSVGIDTSMYKLSKRHRNDRFLALARTGPDKGNLDALYLCKDLGVPLDIISARGIDLLGKPHTDYEKRILELCDGKQFRIWENSVPELEKIKFLQTCKALIYCSPPSHPEVTSHKIQEAMLSGSPVIASNIGALPEIITHGVNGYLCDRGDGFLAAMNNVDKLDVMKIYKETVERFSLESTIKNYIPLYQEVANGKRWA